MARAVTRAGRAADSAAANDRTRPRRPAAGLARPAARGSARVLLTAAVVGATVLAVALLGAGVASAAAAGAGSGAGAADAGASNATLRMADADLQPDGRATVAISVAHLPSGLSGFELTVRLATAGPATIVNASYPSGLRPTTAPRVADSGRTVRLEGADLGRSVEPGARNVTLATVQLRGDRTGSTSLTASRVRLDADGGGRIVATVTDAAVRVGDGVARSGRSGGAGPPQSGGGGVSRTVWLGSAGAGLVLALLGGLALIGRR